jgi:hypothetical protein
MDGAFIPIEEQVPSLLFLDSYMLHWATASAASSLGHIPNGF